MKRAPVFTDLSRLTKALRVWYIIAAAVSLETLVENLRVYWLVNHVPQHEFTRSETIWQYGIYIASLLLTAITFITFMVWVFKSYRNARLISAEATTSPAMAVVYYYIPFLSLYKPYQNMQEVWKICGSPTDWRAQKNSSVVIAWWSLFLVSAFVELAAQRSEPTDQETSLTVYNIYYLLNASSEFIKAAYYGISVLLLGRLWERMKAYAP